MITAIQEVSGVKMEQDVIELKQNTPDGKYIIKKLPGRQKAGEVTLTRGLTADNSFEKWVENVAVRQDGRGPQGRRRSSSSTTRATRSSATMMTNCWPKTLEIGSHEGGDDQTCSPRS